MFFTAKINLMLLSQDPARREPESRSGRLFSCPRVGARVRWASGAGQSAANDFWHQLIGGSDWSSGRGERPLYAIPPDAWKLMWAVGQISLCCQALRLSLVDSCEGVTFRDPTCRDVVIRQRSHLLDVLFPGPALNVFIYDRRLHRLTNASCSLSHPPTHCVPLCHLFDTSKRWHGNTCVGKPDNEEP